ncbi:hypothetical protein ACFSC4_10495 [Deinococcus malanensis]|uniref:hypothetical protein n=1 Tax=Deinococcus malanensis TaxID=1706855 RepID=UPI0036376A9F
MNLTASKFLLDLALWGASGLLAYAFRKPGLITVGIPVNVWGYLLLSVLVMVALEARYGLHRQTWQRVGILDLNVLARAAALATLVMFALGFIFQTWLQLPRSVPVLAGVLGFVLMGCAWPPVWRASGSDFGPGRNASVC